MYVICNILYEFIYKKKFFTLELLNLRIQNFYSHTDDSNKPPIITINRMKQKLNIKYSADEMLYTTRYLGVIIGNKIPAGDEHWNIYILLRKIVDILMSPRIVIGYIKELNKLVRELNSLYLKYFKKLKPKFHFLTHYCSILYTSSQLNLLKTIAIKQVLKMCHIFKTIKIESNIVFKCTANSKKVFINETEYNIGTCIVISTEPRNSVWRNSGYYENC